MSRDSFPLQGRWGTSQAVLWYNSCLRGKRYTGRCELPQPNSGSRTQKPSQGLFVKEAWQASASAPPHTSSSLWTSFQSVNTSQVYFQAPSPDLEWGKESKEGGICQGELTDWGEALSVSSHFLSTLSNVIWLHKASIRPPPPHRLQHIP